MSALCLVLHTSSMFSGGSYISFLKVVTSLAGPVLENYFHQQIEYHLLVLMLNNDPPY